MARPDWISDDESNPHEEFLGTQAQLDRYVASGETDVPFAAWIRHNKGRGGAGQPARPTIDYANTDDPRDVAMERAARRVDAGGTRDDAMATAFGTIVGAGMAGDKRVILDGSGYSESDG